jgi:hypothetical protein
MSQTESGSEPKGRRGKGGLWLALGGSCAVTLLLELIGQREPHEGLKETFAFHALFGFVSCALLIILAKLLGIVLKVEESYYD